MHDAYFCWLVGLIGDDYIQKNYQKLLWKLFVTDYVWELIYDKNRAADGLLLRKEYSEETGCHTDILLRSKPCSVLEMIVALAKGAEDSIMHDPIFGDRTRTWFWSILQNLGLDVYDDYNWYEQEVDRILFIFLHRRYESNGSGGAFPMRQKAIDIRSKDLWWQMNAYLEERFPI